MKAVLVNVGNEVLSGKTINTNASFLSNTLEKIGIEVIKVVTVGDDAQMINKEIDFFKKSNYDLLITTGGLGPTHDDFTKEVLFKNLGVELVERKEAVDLIEKYFEGKYAKCNLKQALYPKDAYLLPNNLGTAMGAVYETSNKMYAILVGPPFEMKPMVNDYLIPYLAKKTNSKKIVKEYIVMGVGESTIEDMLLDYYDEFKDIDTSPYASIGKIRYQLTGSLDNIDYFNKADKSFNEIMADYIVSDCNEEIEFKVYEELLKNNFKISFGESCTGGMLAAKMINVPGASSIIDESFVTYSNSSKITFLGVSKETIDKYDVVSEEVVKEMAVGVQKLTGSEVVCTTSGYAGPTGGSGNITVGNVWYAIKIRDNIYTYHNYFNTDRNTLREKLSMLVLYRVFYLLKKLS